ncbi:MAG: MBL fold metallo-hydrolase [Ilumatobacteraceae bacterium]
MTSQLRVEHVQPSPPEIALHPFDVPTTPTEVWRSDDGTVRVEAVAVHHEPVPEAVAFRVTTPDGVVVISGDTRVCDEVAELATDADVLVHEVCRASKLRDAVAGSPLERIFEYHADSVALGGLAARARVGHLVLTHLIPAPNGAEHEAAFESDVREGGYDGRVTVGVDLAAVTIG